DSVSIENSPPEVIFATIDPSMLYTNDTASISFISNDADGDAVTTNIDWYVDDGNGAVLVSTSATLDGSTAFEKGDVIYAELTPNDGFDDGATVTTSSMTISNTPPEAPVVAIQPSAPIEGEDDMICAVTVDSNDADTADLSNISYTIEWYENGVLFTNTSTTTITGDTISASETTKDEVWECVVIPSDGTDTGTSASTSVIIQQDCDIDDDGFDAPSCGGPDCDDTDPTIGDCFDGSGTWADTTTTLESVVHHVAALDEDETNGELRILVYGGQSYYQLLDQLWEYNIDTDTWASLSYSGVSPEPVYKHAAAFTPSAQQWLIFGGQTYYALSEDLYVLDTNAGSETWYMTSVSSTSSPEARLGSTMVIDSNTDKAYVIGGQGYYTLLDDVWSIDLNNDLNLSTSGSTVSWTEETPGGTLPAVVGASGGFDPNFDSIYLFGGQTYYKLLDSTPCLDLQTMTWTDATLTGDSLPAMVWASVTWSDFIGGFLIHGGQSYYQLIEESYAVIPSASCTAEVITVTPSGDAPPAMLGASLVYDATSGMHYILGGQGYYTLYDSLISFQP
ncbi:MAG: kelch repeat-containing protein, partial [Myxococcota bacterium]|nr:kelch repeat-containing protein [Myxococcota bacterium]